MFQKILAKNKSFPNPCRFFKVNMRTMWDFFDMILTLFYASQVAKGKCLEWEAARFYAHGRISNNLSKSLMRANYVSYADRMPTTCLHMFLHTQHVEDGHISWQKEEIWVHKKGWYRWKRVGTKIPCCHLKHQSWSSGWSCQYSLVYCKTFISLIAESRYFGDNKIAGFNFTSE